MGRGWLVSLLDGAPQRPLPASPLAGMAKASAADCAAALLAGWRAQVPDCTEVQPRRDVIEYEESGERLQLAALSSPRRRDERVVVEWISDDAAWGNGALWITFPGMTLATGEIERAAEWDMSEAFWTGVGLLRNGVRYGRSRFGRPCGHVHVDEADSWAVLGVHEPLGLERSWVRRPRPLST